VHLFVTVFLCVLSFHTYAQVLDTHTNTHITCLTYILSNKHIRTMSIQWLHEIQLNDNDTQHDTIKKTMHEVTSHLLSVALFYCYAECRYAERCYAESHYAESHYAECHYAECCHAEYCYAECRYAECHYAECHYAECH
jgi:hypothetical protein